LRPTAADRERIARALSERIGAGAGGLSQAPAATAVKVHALSWPVVSAAVVGLAAGGLLIAGVLRMEPVPVPFTTQRAPSAVAPSGTPSSAELAATAAEPAPQPATASDARPSDEGPQARARRQQADRLAEEVAILSRAQTELHAGRFASALRVLEEHVRKFPRGKLAQERRATRIQALCGAGRTIEADAELARLAPGSVHEGRARQACEAKR
jgi:hypothetical protein